MRLEMPRTQSRYPTRSTVNRAQNNNSSGLGGGGGSSAGISTSAPERRTSERTRSHTSVAPPAHDYSRSHHHQAQSHGGGHSVQAPYNQTAALYPPMSRYANAHDLQQLNLQSGHPMLSTRGPNCSLQQGLSNLVSSNAAAAAQVYRANGYPGPAYSMPNSSFLFNKNDVRFIKLNSYEDMKVLIKPRSITMSNMPGNNFLVNDVTGFLSSENYRVFLRFCKYVPTTAEQQDCLPKSFNLMINQSAFQVKNKYTFAPYDITTRIACEKSNDVQIRISIDPNSNEVNEEFHYGLYLVKKVDHRLLLEKFKSKPVYDKKHSIELAKRKLNPPDDGDEIAIVENSNQMKVHLNCPLSATRIKIPARSKYCDHVHCFDAESFIGINEITPRWKCPHCKIYIKLDDLIQDGLFLQILREAPSHCLEAEILPDGRYEFIVDQSKIASGASTASASTSTATVDTSNSHATKRKFDEDVKDVVRNVASSSTTASPPTKMQKSNEDIEVITLDSSDEDETSSNSDTITSQNGESDAANDANNAVSDDDDDDDIQIVFEKIIPRTGSTGNNSAASSSGGGGGAHSNSNSNASSSGGSASHTPTPNYGSVLNGAATTAPTYYSQQVVAPNPYIPTYNTTGVSGSTSRATTTNESALHRSNSYTAPSQHHSSTGNGSGSSSSVDTSTAMMGGNFNPFQYMNGGGGGGRSGSTANNGNAFGSSSSGGSSNNYSGGHGSSSSSSYALPSTSNTSSNRSGPSAAHMLANYATNGNMASYLNYSSMPSSAMINSNGGNGSSSSQADLT